MTILITAAGGKLGRLTIDSLIARGAAPDSILAGVRNPATTPGFPAGVRTVEMDFEKPETIAAALDGVDSVLLISLPELGNRAVPQGNVISAAAAAGVGKLVYTSAPKATTADFVLAPEHKATEEAIAASGIPAVILRNNWYNENYAGDLARAAETGVLPASVGDGRIASASRADLADAAAVVLLEDGHLGQVYELGGDTAWNYTELAAAISAAVGREVTYVPQTTEEHVAALESAGLDAGTAAFVAGIDTGIRNGVLESTDRTLSRLIGRPTTPIADTLREFAPASA